MENFNQKNLKELKKMSASEYEAYLDEMQNFIKERRKENAKALHEEKLKKENARNKEVYLSLKKVFDKVDQKARYKDMIKAFETYFNNENSLKYLTKVYEDMKHEQRQGRTEKS